MRRIHALLMTAGLAAAPAGAAAAPDPMFPDQARLGVMVMTLTPELRTHFGSLDKTGVLIARVEPGSPAAMAGIAVGDVIVDVRGTKVDDAGDVVSALSNAGKDTKVKVKVLRDRKLLSFDVSLGPSTTSALDWPPMNWLRQLLQSSEHSNST